VAGLAVILHSLKRPLTLIRDVYNKAGLRGLYRLTALADDYLNEAAVMRGSPLFLQIEPTIQCNLECAFCINPFLPRKRASLSVADFEQILEQIPSTIKISLVGIGESFMNKDLWAIIRRAKARGLSIGTTSNGTILTERILEEIVDCGLDWLNFSVDGATKETYERMRPGANYEDMLSNIRRVVAAFDGRPRPELAIWFLATRENVDELPDMVDLTGSLGISSLNTQGVHYWGSNDWHDRANEANRVENLSATLLETKRRADAVRIEFKWHNIPDIRAGRQCKWPWKGAYITADGFVTPCCENGSDPARINFGNIFQRPFAEIWNSSEYQNFRRELASSKGRPAICIDCPSYHKAIKLSPATST
jgi:radical SAM protein with 4Fe4S-binding SPASM domain